MRTSTAQKGIIALVPTVAERRQPGTLARVVDQWRNSTQHTPLIGPRGRSKGWVGGQLVVFAVSFGSDCWTMIVACHSFSVFFFVFFFVVVRGGYWGDYCCWGMFCLIVLRFLLFPIVFFAVVFVVVLLLLLLYFVVVFVLWLLTGGLGEHHDE